ncbi:MAG: Boron transporter 4 [Alyxoria varia]|nr:MAG: Boron transporter 4 [Alyxoria varia]
MGQLEILQSQVPPLRPYRLWTEDFIFLVIRKLLQNHQRYEAQYPPRRPSSITHRGQIQPPMTRPSSLLAIFRRTSPLHPAQLFREDLHSLKSRYSSDWTLFNQQVVASAVYAFFTNLLPGITFASDLYVLTGRSWGTIEVVLSTGICGIVFAL